MGNGPIFEERLKYGFVDFERYMEWFGDIGLVFREEKERR